MNPLLLNFCLMIFWGVLALFMLVIGPLFAPDLLPDKGRGSWLGFGACVMTVWNFIRFWSIRSYRREHRMQAMTYRQTRNPQPATSEPKPILHPEFKFDEQAKPPKQVKSNE